MGFEWSDLNPFSGEDPTWLDAAVPFLGATRLAYNYGGKQAIGAVKNAVTGGDDKKAGDAYAGGNPLSYQYNGEDGMAGPLTKAGDTGDWALKHGRNSAEAYGEKADAMGQRAALQGDWGMQNGALASASGYGSASAGYGTQLGGLEATQGPSAAQAQLQTGTNQALGNQLALARSGRGMGGGSAAMGLAQGNLAGIQANQANQSSMLRAQEDAAWRQRQAANLGNAAGIQANAAQIQMGIGSQFGEQGQADLGAALQSRGMNDQAALGYSQLGEQAFTSGVSGSLASQGLQHDIRQSQLSANMAREDASLRAWAAQNGYELQQRQMEEQRDTARLQAGASLLQAGATHGVGSDVRGKTDIVPAQGAGTDFARAGSMVNLQQPDTAALDAARAAPGSFYRYKDPSADGADGADHFGPMAQDLAKTPAGATAVTKMKDGKLGVDTGRLALVNTSAISAQQKQIDELEARIRSFNAQPGAAYPQPTSPYPSRGSF